MAVFLALGGFGLLLLIASLALGDLADVDPGDLGVGPVTLAAVAAAVAAFGLGGTAVLRYSSASAVTASTVGAVLAAVVGGLAVWGTRALIGGEHAPVRATDLLGVFGTVVTPIPATGLGEVVVPHAGSRAKFSARSSQPVAAGQSVYVIEIASPTCLVVESLGL